jgi:hypothetical protein
MAMSRPTTSQIVSLALAGVALLVAGCQDVDWSWERNWSQRPSPDTRPASYQRAPAERAVPVPLPTEPDLPPASPPQTQEPELVEEGFYQLYLTNDSSPAANSESVKWIVLSSVAAGRVVRTLEVLCPPIGAGGREKSSYLVYQDPTAWQLATRLAPMLDCPTVEVEPTAPPPSATKAFDRAVGMYYLRCRPGGKLDQPGLRRVLALLEGVAASDQARSQLRWASASLTGHIRSKFFFEFRAAHQAHRRGQDYCPADSYERMVCLYYQADSLLQDHQAGPASAILADLLETFGQYSNTRLYQRCRKLAQGS